MDRWVSRPSHRRLVQAAAVAALLLISGLVQGVFADQEMQRVRAQVEYEKASAAASTVDQYLRQVERQIAWTLQQPWTTGAGGLDQRRSDYLRLMRQEQAVTEVRYIDSRGMEVVRPEPLDLLLRTGNGDLSGDPRFLLPKPGRPYLSAVYFRNESEPYMTVAIAETGPDAGVVVAEVSLKFLWDVVSKIRIGREGYGYVVDQGGNVLAHPNISQVLQKSDYSALPQVQRALAGPPVPPTDQAMFLHGRDPMDREVLAAYAPVGQPLGWAVIIEEPVAAVHGSLLAAVPRTVLIAVLGLVLWLLVPVTVDQWGRMRGRLRATPPPST
jgi:hypothetical protein